MKYFPFRLQRSLSNPVPQPIILGIQIQPGCLNEVTVNFKSDAGTLGPCCSLMSMNNLSGCFLQCFGNKRGSDPIHTSPRLLCLSILLVILGVFLVWTTVRWQQQWHTGLRCGCPLRVKGTVAPKPPKHPALLRSHSDRLKMWTLFCAVKSVPLGGQRLCTSLRSSQCPRERKHPFPTDFMSRDWGRRDKARHTSYHTMRPGCSSEQTKKVFMELWERGQGRTGWGGRHWCREHWMTTNSQLATVPPVLLLQLEATSMPINGLNVKRAQE